MSETTNTETGDIQKMEITINLKDLDLSQLTSSVMSLGANMNTYLMQVFKEAYEKGLKSGYVLGHKNGYDDGHKLGIQKGKKEGVKQGRREAISEYTRMLKESEEQDDDMEYQQPVTMGTAPNFQQFTTNQYNSQCQSEQLKWG